MMRVFEGVRRGGGGFLSQPRKNHAHAKTTPACAYTLSRVRKGNGSVKACVFCA